MPGQDLEVAHYKSKQMGGDKKGDRSHIWNLITFEHRVHQGPFSIHSGHRKVEPLTERVMNGPCQFFERPTVGAGYGPWRLVGVEVEVGVLI